MTLSVRAATAARYAAVVAFLLQSVGFLSHPMDTCFALVDCQNFYASCERVLRESHLPESSPTPNLWGTKGARKL